MNAKEHVQALVDESLVRVEKIGAGNWYWAFGSDAKKGREAVLAALRAEDRSVSEKVEVLRGQVGERKAADQEAEAEADGEGRDELRGRVEGLRGEVDALKVELGRFEEGDPAALEEMRREVERARQRAEVWTDNCWVLEGWVRDELGADREAVDGLRRECYGNEYVEGEGLTEIT